VPVRDLASSLLVLGALLAVLSLLIRGSRPLRGEGSRGAHRVRALRRYRAPTSSGTLMTALGGLALATLSTRPETALVVGVVVGVLGSGERGSGWALGLIGSAGAVQAVGDLVSGQSCAPGDVATRLAAAIVVAALFSATFLVGRHLPGNRRSTSLAAGGLGLFVVLEVVSFLAVPVAAGSLSGLAAASFAAIFFGLASGYAPVLTPLLLGAAVAVTTSGTAATLGTACSPLADPAQLVAAAVFTGVVVGVRIAVGATMR
jgi:hypothetical protein